MRGLPSTRPAARPLCTGRGSSVVPTCRHPLALPRRAPSSRARSGGLDPEALTDAGVPLAALQARLDAAIDGEDYAAAAALRDEIGRRRGDARAAVEEANDRFYAAFQSGSVRAMGEAWGDGEHVQCIHPLAGCVAGRAAVMESWRLVLGSARLKVELRDVRVYAGEAQAFVTCVELMESGDGRGRIQATNVFEKQKGKWKIVHHHGSPAR